MTNTSKISDRDIRFYRRLRRNRVFSELLAYYAKIAEENGIRKSDIATRLGKQPSQITRWFAEPVNLTLDTISDLLLAMNAELVFGVVPASSDRYTAEDFMQEFKDWAENQEDITVSAQFDDLPIFITSAEQTATSASTIV